ncbi:MFS transporter [Termitidicoccus mucosus]|uniref:Major facilitator superfamily (MFS) profile domain-containing protein n=1 Tax=Termitidicoccus mucosus TaxID=1184151 RepID=A0A178ILR2_9BACT|nr:hypothetical protein AW736_07360 [Opitutaceae bacterium TSB47]
MKSPSLESGGPNAAAPGLSSPEMMAYYGNRGLMWRNFSMILLLNLGWAVSFTVINPLIQLRLNNAGVSEAGIGNIGAVNHWVYCYAVMFFAWKSDHTVTRFGRRIPYLFLSAPFIVFAIVMFPFCELKWVLIGLALLQMFFMDIKAATIPLLNIDCMPRKLLARMDAPSKMAMAALSFLALRHGMKLSDQSETLPFLLAGAILVATTLIGGFAIKEPPVRNPSTEGFRPFSAMKIAWRDKRAVVLMISVSLFETFQIAFVTWVWLYAQNALGMTRAQTGLCVSWGILFSMCAAFPLGWLIDRVSPYRLLPVFCLICAGAAYCVLHARTPLFLTLAACLSYTLNVFYGASDIMVYRNAAPAEIGSVTSTNSFLRGAYRGVMALLMGHLISRSGGCYDYVFILAAALTVAGLVPLFIYRRLMAQPPRKES